MLTIGSTTLPWCSFTQGKSLVTYISLRITDHCGCRRCWSRGWRETYWLILVCWCSVFMSAIRFWSTTPWNSSSTSSRAGRPENGNYCVVKHVHPSPSLHPSSLSPPLLPSLTLSLPLSPPFLSPPFLLPFPSLSPHFPLPLPLPLSLPYPLHDAGCKNNFLFFQDSSFCQTHSDS